MAKLYTLVSGKISRRVADSNGNISSATFKAPYTFVPSPSEFAGNKHRLREAGEVSNDSAENVSAFLNTNLLDNPEVHAPKSLKGEASQKFTIEDITELKDTPAALAAISAAVDEDTLAKFQKQELTSTTRVRTVVLKAIEARKKELKAEASTGAVAASE